ncbi:GtrA family protein [Hymenobacter terrenus]|uniref:GtrA family protein n=1 Tax=Hymenobacter terrenus TaxID=1629124 RepID=UPI0006199EB8|nr:GtrA family protein [Hymenobacter terrenus]
MRYSRLVKAQAASLAGTAVDFLVTIGCVEVLHSWYLAATVLGNIAGGITNFCLGRYLVFDASQQNAPLQGGKYFLVWLGSMLLNATGIYLFTQVLHANYVYSKIVVSLLVGIGFNYFLQLHFVFKKS